MPWGYVAGYYLYGKSKKRQQKPAPLNASQQSILDFLNASKTTTLSDKDTSLLVSTDTIQYGSEQDNYLGPPFGTSDDYVEVLIYDTQDNFLESGVVDESDYFYDEEEEGIKIKTGTVLRKMGYDRGRFKVLYNFLRKMAGSYETLVTDTEGKVYTGEVDESEINKSLFIKENKYPIHEISDSRTELRLISKNIRDEEYLRNFYKLGAKETKYQADETPISNVEFAGTAEDKSTSKEIKFISTTGMSEGRFDQSMRGGKIIIPNFFVISKKTSQIPAADSNFKDTSERFDGSEMRCSFRTVGVQNGSRRKNSKNMDGDLQHSIYHQYFEGLSINDVIVHPVTGEPITNEYGKNNTKNSKEAYDLGINLVHLHGSAERLVDDKSDSGVSSRISNIFEVQEWAFERMWVNKAGGIVTFDLESTSVFETDSTVEYEWTIFGWDFDGPNWYQSQRLSRKIAPDGSELTSNADIKIEAPPDGRYAAESTDGAGMVATKTVSPTDAAFDRSTYADGTRPGCRLRFSCYSGKTHVGVQLKIKDNSRNQSRTTALPDIYFVW